MLDIHDISPDMFKRGLYLKYGVSRGEMVCSRTHRVTGPSIAMMRPSSTEEVEYAIPCDSLDES